MCVCVCVCSPGKRKPWRGILLYGVSYTCSISEGEESCHCWVGCVWVGCVYVVRVIVGGEGGSLRCKP